MNQLFLWEIICIAIAYLQFRIAPNAPTNKTIVKMSIVTCVYTVHTSVLQ